MSGLLVPGLGEIVLGEIVLGERVLDEMVLGEIRSLGSYVLNGLDDPLL